MTGRTKRAVTALVAIALAVPAFVGVGRAAGGGAPAPNYINLDKVPKPGVTGKEIMAGLEEYVDKFPMRQNGLPNNIPASDFLAKEAKGYGFKTRVLELEVPSTPARTVRVIEAVKKGTTKPDEWISFIAHYDVIAGAGFTVQGAYDDGSGTNILRYFAKAFSKVKTNRSIAILWFDAEENGLLASQAYTDMLQKKGQKIQAAFGFDMVGIGYPARYCICVYHGPRPQDAAIAAPITDYVNFKYLKFPEGDGGPTAAEKWPLGTEGHVCSCGPNIRNSDESNFASAGYFSMRWTGMRTAADYPGYHQPWDTVPFMELVAGGRENLEAAIENTFNSAWYTAHVVDNLPYLGGPTK
jgi:hypothetical protein